MTEEQTCDTCYKIICRECGWEASDEQVTCIRKGEITACPECGWAPREIL